MSRVAQLFDMSQDEANRLSEFQVNRLMKGVEDAVESMVQNNPVFRQALKQKLLTTRRFVIGR